jgi:hypothetical protein
MIVSGRAELGPADPPPQAVAQLLLRYRLAAMAADAYATPGSPSCCRTSSSAAIWPTWSRRSAPGPCASWSWPRGPMWSKRASTPASSPAARRRTGRRSEPGGTRRGLAPRDAAHWPVLDTSAQAVAETVEEILGRFQAEAEAEVATALRPPAGSRHHRTGSHHDRRTERPSRTVTGSLLRTSASNRWRWVGSLACRRAGPGCRCLRCPRRMRACFW